MGEKIVSKGITWNDRGLIDVFGYNLGNQFDFNSFSDFHDAVKKIMSPKDYSLRVVVEKGVNGDGTVNYGVRKLGPAGVVERTKSGQFLNLLDYLSETSNLPHLGNKPDFHGWIIGNPLDFQVCNGQRPYFFSMGDSIHNASWTFSTRYSADDSKGYRASGEFYEGPFVKGIRGFLKESKL